MIKSIRDRKMNIRCNCCGHIFWHTILEEPKCFLQEFEEYENYQVVCPECSAIEIFNMNIPVDDTDEPFMTGDLPTDEEVQRHFVRILQRIVREDFCKR